MRRSQLCAVDDRRGMLWKALHNDPLLSFEAAGSGHQHGPRKQAPNDQGNRFGAANVATRENQGPPATSPR